MVMHLGVLRNANGNKMLICFIATQHQQDEVKVGKDKYEGGMKEAWMGIFSSQQSAPDV